MTVREELSSMFDYDRWANLQWWEPAKSMGKEEILLHVVHAQIIWLTRIEGTPVWEPTLEDYPLHLDRSIGRWKRFLLGADLGAVISYTNSAGDHYDSKVSEIIRHVINHGTYHRGQLRGIAGERGVAFPESDYIHFVRSPFASAGQARAAAAMSW
jgi:uncharacterized damage-inducible protein DinB